MMMIEMILGVFAIGGSIGYTLGARMARKALGDAAKRVQSRK